ncbi:MAG: hypothetical protein JSS09_05640, partial [Verrucomicrobia bacterium]|nr:hypothetical protein [Verrucomicrobiota bacterium]
IVSVFINVIISYVDWQSLMKNWDAPVGKLEDRVNTLKLLTGIGCIAGICLLSASTLGTAPVAIALIITSSMVIASVWRHVHTRQKRAQEKEALASMNVLIGKLAKIKEKEAISEADKAKKAALEIKIQKIILRKLQYTHKSILENINNKEEWIERITHISEQDINKIREDISLWQDSENAIIQELQDAFKWLDAIPMRDRSWKELFMQFFSDVPHFRRIFPEEEKVV